MKCLWALGNTCNDWKFQSLPVIAENWIILLHLLPDYWDINSVIMCKSMFFYFTWYIIILIINMMIYIINMMMIYIIIIYDDE